MPSPTELDGFEQTAYRPILRLNKGAAADVLLAEHTGLEKLVALKALRTEFAEDLQLIDRMRFEAQTLSRLTSPHLVLVTDVGRTRGGRPYFVMEHLLGHTLDKELHACGVLSVSEAISLARRALEGLAVVHAAGVVHRGVRPEHLFLTRHGQAPWALKIIGFGMAKALAVDETVHTPKPVAFMTRKGELLGSPLYLSPEQILGERVDERADLYALGCVLFKALTGAPPLADSGGADLLRAHLEVEPRAPSTMRPNHAIPRALDEVVLRALAKDPGARFPTARAFAAELARVEATVASPARPQTAGLDASASALEEPQARMFRVGEVFERFEITNLLGVGFMGEVYEVAHRHLDRRFAIKFLRLAHRADVDKVERSLAEAEVMMRMDHANIVRVHDAGVTADGTVWMRMDRLHGKPLRELIGRARLSTSTALQIAEEIAWGLDHAHELSVIHRDVKPENVFITTEPRVVLLDLGLAKFIPYGLKKTAPLRLLGTMAYTAPERLAGATIVDGRVDIYSLGVVLFEMLAGEHPYADVIEDAAALGRAHLTREPRSLVELGVPEHVDALVRKLMAKDPNGRFFTAAESAKALRAARQRLAADVHEGRCVDEGLRLDVTTHPTHRKHAIAASPVERTVDPTETTPAGRRRRRAWLLAALGAALLGAGALVQVLGRTPSQDTSAASSQRGASPDPTAPTLPAVPSSTPNASTATEVAAPPSATVDATASAAATTSAPTSTSAPARAPHTLAPPARRPKLPF